MTNIKASLVFTTIFDPVVLETYYKNFESYGKLNQVQVIVIPDKKTPKETFVRCENLRKKGFDIVCPTIDEQEGFLKKIGLQPNFIPYNSDNRRNVGYLMAYESGSDFLISIDDDNFCCDNEDFFSEHAVVCENSHNAKIVNSKTGWFNICSQMELDRVGNTYARGFPYYARHNPENPTFKDGKVAVHINAGLWLIDPDVDALSWLVAPAKTVKFKGQSLVLGEKAWSPINTQNTAMRREAVAAYYFVKMGYPLGGINIDRYGDIFSGFLVQACARYLKGGIRVGSPIAEHKRNSHNYMNDAFNEWSCILVLNDLLPWLSDGLELSGNNYIEVYESLSSQIEDVVEKFEGKIWTDATRGYFHQMGYCMRQWTKSLKNING